MPNDKVNHGRSKFISNYGGVGSIIDTIDSSIIIETFDNWQYDQLQNRIANYIVKDDRFLNRLQVRFPNLRHLVKIPTENSPQTDQVRPTANYCPKWFHCTRCHRFADYNEWKKRWTSAGKKTDFFNPPKCSNGECKEQKLEQVRFLMICPNGHIHDIPWRHWNLHLPTPKTQKNDTDNEDDTSKQENTLLDLSKTCCDKQDLRYEISKENTELSGIWIKCKSCGKAQTLKGIFGYEHDCEGKKTWLGLTNGQIINENCKAKSKVVIKSSNSVYYANTLSSIYIPERQNSLTNDIRIEIDNLKDDPDYTNEEIAKFISKTKKIDKEIIKNYLDKGEINYISETVFRQTEYNYFLNNEQPETNELKFRVINCKIEINGFEKLVKIDRIKKITAQTSFTRQEPIDVDAILQEDGTYEYNVQRQSVSKNNFGTKYLPAIESYGEGILFILDNQKLRNWENNSDIINRVDIIKENAQNSDWKSHQIEAEKLTPRKLLIHTLSHLIIRELEYVCGYPASSLQERLYVSDTMHGFLISAYDGTDGYLGGLANLCNDLQNLREIINSALYRAKDCSLDPICFESEGQGIAQLNLSACHSCTLTPDITCELSNLFLDRKLVIGVDYSYFDL